MLNLHAGTQADDELGNRFLECFVQALEDAGLPGDQEFRRALRSYMEWATGEVHRYSPEGSVVPLGIAVPRWGWDGLESGEEGSREGAGQESSATISAGTREPGSLANWS
jgi:hemoglobin